MLAKMLMTDDFLIPGENANSAGALYFKSPERAT
jgi:hypothetical protein